MQIFCRADLNHSQSCCRTSKEGRQQEGFWKKYLWFLAISYHGIFNVITYDFLASTMSSISREYQWIVALLSPLVREYGVWIETKMSSKASSGLPPHKLMISHFKETRHAVFLSIMLGGIATPESTYCIIAMDFIINIYHGLKIVKKLNAGKNGKLIKVCSR